MSRLKGKTPVVAGSPTSVASANALAAATTLLTGSVDTAVAAVIVNQNTKAKNREANKDRLAARKRP